MGDIYFNGNEVAWKDILSHQHPPEKGTTADLIRTTVHELGHILGLGHVDDGDNNPDSVMFGTANIRFDKQGYAFGTLCRVPSAKDIQRLHALYRCEGAACKINETRASLVTSSQKFQERPSDIALNPD